MFRKLTRLGKKGSDNSRETRGQQSISEFRNPTFSSSDISVEKEHIETISSRTSTSAGEVQQTRRDSEPDTGPLGLNVIYTPEHGHKADIVFLHGLGGTSRMTWSKHKDPELFWPLTFLPLEPDICLARIMTFGYNASVHRAGNVGTSILDFAKGLLFDLKYAKDEQMEDLNMGNVPLVFVVHSMGGLIVKEAYMQGQNDPEYESIVKAISAIAFLATPHRGTDLANILNRILQSAMVTNSKQYISDLAKNSFTLQKLNEQFRHIAPRLDIISLYETRPTSIGLKNTRVMILEKDSSVLGYPGETSKALDADHHGVCKYDSPRDPNYIAVRNVLKSIVSKIISSTAHKRPLTTRRESHDLKSLLAITELPGVDYSFFRDQWVQGTSDWILQDTQYLEWLNDPDQSPRLLWINGGAAAGKSVLSSFIINDLVEKGASCQYFFIRFGHQKKRSLSLILRSIAYQLAQSWPEFSHKLVDLKDEGIEFETANSRTIWECIFRLILFEMKERQHNPVYWVIDGLDEADDPRTIIRTLSSITSSSIPIRILLAGRNSSEMETAFQKVPKTLNLRSISIEGHQGDMRCFIRGELTMSGSADFKESVIERLVKGAQNNFLWIRLVVNKVNMCHTRADVERALKELPAGMEALYDRMALSIAESLSPTDKKLASIILQCVTCSLRVLTVAELSQALDQNTSEMLESLDLQQSIIDLCRGFVVIDNGGNVDMVHQTAREYLLSRDGHRFHIDRDAAHQQMLLSCMRCLMAAGLRAKLSRKQKPEFLEYAASLWSSHLILSRVDCEQTFQVLKRFLTGQWILTWIHALAVSNHLRILVQASKNLSKYAAKRKVYDAARGELPIVEQELLESWAVDLVKIVGKFGISLRRNPESIYKIVPPFCPQNSSIYQLFGKNEAKSLMVSGLSSENWDDSLARMSLGYGTRSSFILAAGSQVAVLASPGSVFMYDSSTFEESPSSPFTHGERVYRMELNSNATVLATYGYRTVKFWEISTGKCKVSVETLRSRPRPLTMLFVKNNTELLVGFEDRKIRSLKLDGYSPPTWQPVAELEEDELEGHNLNSASYMALNRDGSLVAVAYRGHPLSAWETDGPMHIGHCWRKREEISRGEVIEAVWHPQAPEVLGLYIEGVVFKWRPYENEVDEMATGASRLAIGRDGILFATGDVHGTVKVFTTSGFYSVYQLASQENVLGLTFSPDLRRFYDIRGYYANAWEPNALMRFAEQTGKDNESETDSLAHSSAAYISKSRSIDAITALACSPSSRFYCCGTEKGTVRLHNSSGAKIADLFLSEGVASIEQIAWSKDGRYISFSDSDDKVVIISITPGTGQEYPLVNTIAKIEVEGIKQGGILQLLFHTDSSQLLIHSASTTHTVSLTSYSIMHSLGSMDPQKWINHPQDPSLIIGFRPGVLEVLDWTLIKRYSYTFELPFHQSVMASPSSSPDQTAIDRILLASDKKQVLAQMSSSKQGSQGKTLLLFKTSSFSISTTATQDVEQKQPAILTPTILPSTLSDQIAIPLSFLSRDRLVFLSKSFSIYIWQITPGADSFTSPAPSSWSGSPGRRSDTNMPDIISKNMMKELFSLPGDWISRDCLVLCNVWGVERSFLCPRNGEIAVVKCAALA